MVGMIHLFTADAAALYAFGRRVARFISSHLPAHVFTVVRPGAEGTPSFSIFFRFSRSLCLQSRSVLADTVTTPPSGAALGEPGLDGADPAAVRLALVDRAAAVVAGTDVLMRTSQAVRCLTSGLL
jgi:hypothetical protein